MLQSLKGFLCQEFKQSLTLLSLRRWTQMWQHHERQLERQQFNVQWERFHKLMDVFTLVCAYKLL